MTGLHPLLHETSDADDFERAVLRAGLPADPPAGAEAVVWSGVLGALAAAPLAVTSAVGASASAKTALGGASKAAAVWLGVGKGFVVGLALYGAVTGAAELAARFAPPQAPSAPVASAVSTASRARGTPRPSALAPVSTADRASNEDSAEPPPASSALATPAAAAVVGNAPRSSAASADERPASAELGPVAAFPNPVSGVRSSQLQAEVAALRSARADLRAGKLADAFATLEAGQRQFTAPELYQEREALLIELLSRSGQVAAAKQRASAFLTRFPDSPHAQAIRELTRR